MNTYQTKYEDLINFRKNIQPFNRWNKLHKAEREANLPPAYGEYHHIQPRSIRPDLVDDPDNIVCLTAYEHVLAHKYLAMWYLEEYGLKHKWTIALLTAIDQLLITKDNDVLPINEAAKLKALKSMAQSIRQTGQKFSGTHLENLRQANRNPIRAKKVSETRLARKIAPWNKGMKFDTSKPSQYDKVRGKTFVTNGTKTIIAYPDQIPEGFHKGTTQKTVKGKIHVNDGQKTILVYPDQIPNGFVVGSLVKGHSGKILVNNGTIDIYVCPNEIPAGFNAGSCKCSIAKGTMWVNNGKISKMIKGPDIPEGFIKGRLSFKKNKHK